MNRIWTALLAAPVALAGCGYSAPTEGGNVAPPPTGPNDIRIVVGAKDLTTIAFNPNPKTVSLGGNSSVIVRWVNGDVAGKDYTTATATVHTIVSDNGAFTSGPLGGNATFSATLTAAGGYPYHCGIHPNMVGTITVDP